MRNLSILLLALLLATAAQADKAERAIAGRVAKLDGINVIVVLSDRGREVTVPTDEKTEIRVDGEAAKVSDLKANMIVKITQVDGLTTRIEAKKVGEKSRK